MKKKSVIEETISFLRETGLSENEVLTQIQSEKERSREFVRNKRKELELDEKLFNNQKNNVELIGDTTMFNVHTALMARSFSDKSTITFRGTTGEEQKVKMFQRVYNEDFDTPEMKMVKYQRDYDKFLYGVGIVARTGWDGTYKRNKFQVVDPKTWYPDLSGDYITGCYSYTGFDRLSYMSEMEGAGYINLKDLSQIGGDDTSIQQQREDTQEALGYEGELGPNPVEYNGQYEIYVHFAIFNGKKGFVITGNNETLILSAGLLKPGNKFEEKDPSLIQFPFNFFYWKPRRYDPFGFRVADFIRDVQINKAKIANLRLDKMKAELYPMYLFNSDYVKGTDLGFGFNKFIPFKTGVDGPVSPQNIVSPLVPNTRIDGSLVVDQTMDKQVERSTSIGDVAQGTTTENRETLGTNQLVQSNTDINLSLNTKLNNISEELMVREWARGYYINFKDADKKLVYASEGMMEMPMVLKKEDFLIDGNLKIDIETSSETEFRKNKLRLSFNQTVPLILQDPNIPDVSKRRALRRVWEANDVPQNQIDEELPKLPDEIKQEQENQLLAQGIYIDIKPEDDDLVHLVCVESVQNTKEGILHKHAHLQQYIAKGKPSPTTGAPGGVLNNMAAQGMAQMANEGTSLQK